MNEALTLPTPSIDIILYEVKFFLNPVVTSILLLLIIERGFLIHLGKILLLWITHIFRVPSAVGNLLLSLFEMVPNLDSS